MKSSTCKPCKVICLVILCGFLCGECHVDVENTDWLNASATFYGGSQGGACGYGNAVNSPPWAGRCTAAGDVVFQNGAGCGSCYHVKCMENGVCSDSGTTLVVVDRCPNCVDKHNFDIFQSTLVNLVIDPDDVSHLINKGQFNLLYKRVPCDYPGKSLSFKVTEGSNKYWFEVMVMYVGRDGVLSGVELQQSSQEEWMPMCHEWGANWKLKSPSSPLVPPFSLRVTFPSGKTLSFKDVIPSPWKSNIIYTPSSKFHHHA